VARQRMPRLFDTSLRFAAPGPRGAPIVNNFRYLLTAADYISTRMTAFHDQPIAPVTAGNGSILLAFGPAAVREYFTDNDTFHRAGEGVFNLPPGRPYSRMFEAVITANGAEHKRRRRLLMPVVQKSALDHYQELFAETYATSRFATPSAEPFDMVEELLLISKSNMLRGLLGLSVTPEHLRLASAIVALTEGLVRPQVVLAQWDRSWTPYGRWLGEIEAAYHALAKLIDERRGQPERPDALSIVCNTVDEDGQFLTTEEVAGELHAFFSAGFETTAMTMVWALVTLLAEGRELDVTRADVIDACVKESQRLLPATPISLPRRVVRDVSVNGSPTVPAGALIYTSPLVEQHREGTFADAYRYIPQRWLDPDFAPKPWEFLPFGIGARRCLGAAFADLQARTTLGLIGASGRLPRLITTDVDYRMKSGILGAPKGPIIVSYDGEPSGPVAITGSVTRHWHPLASARG
jgi:cytochrome P450